MGLLHYLLPRGALPPPQPCLSPPTIPSGCWGTHPTSWAPPQGAWHPTPCSGGVGGTQAQQHPWRLGGGLGGREDTGGVQLSQAGAPRVRFGAEQTPRSFADGVTVSHSVDSTVLRCPFAWHCPVPCPCPSWSCGGDSRAVDEGPHCTCHCPCAGGLQAASAPWSP